MKLTESKTVNLFGYGALFFIQLVIFPLNFRLLLVSSLAEFLQKLNTDPATFVYYLSEIIM